MGPGPALSWIYDVVRGTVIFDSARDVVKFVKALLTEEDLTIIKLKNRSAFPLYECGYRDLLLNISVTLPDQTQHICELQIHFRALKNTSIKYKSHETYSFFRHLFRGNYAEVSKRMKALIELDRALGGQLRLE